MTPLKKKITDRSAKVGVLGMGYVGLPLAIRFAQAKFDVLGFEVDKPRLKCLNEGVSYITDIPSSELAEVRRSGHFRATNRFDLLRDCDVILICVPTPLRKTREPDNSYVYNACLEISKRLRKGQLIVLESTTYPGTTEEMALPLLEEGGLKAGRDFFLAFSPERVDPANKTFGIRNTPKVVGGITAACTGLAGSLYGHVVDKVVAVSTAQTAEMVKLLENTFRAVNIALVNEMTLMCDRLGIDVWEVVSAAATKPFGYMPFFPGPGLGGHCIPVDPAFLAWKMKSLNFEPRFIDLAGAINSQMPNYTVDRIGRVLNDVRKPVRGSHILVLGVSYKPAVNDIRESPSLDVMKLLMDRGAVVSYHDPFVPTLDFQGVPLKSQPLTPARLKKVDMVAIMTAHPNVDYEEVIQSARMVFDARNAVAGMKSKKIYRL